MTVNPEQDYRFAGFWWRVWAYLIDLLILSVAGGIAGGVIGAALERAGWSIIGIEVSVFVLAIIWNWLYFALFESSSWRATPGKRACGLIVTGKQGERISFGRAIGRDFAKILSGTILLIGYMMAGWTRQKQALHDMICGTLVLKKVRSPLRIDVPKAA
jgi:uncharacterized RDD family membrane protein YckC